MGTGKRRLRLRSVLVSCVAFFLIFLVCKSILGQSKPKPDDDHYNSVSADTVAREGTVILKVGNLEIRKGASASSNRGQGSPTLADTSDTGQVISRKDRSKAEYVLPAGTKIQVSLEGVAVSNELTHPLQSSSPTQF
jgi:hypothetical protein